MTGLRFVFARRWHPDATLWSRLRAAWLIVRGWETEICLRCGGKVGMVWHAPDPLWVELAGWGSGGGVLCLRCFDALAGPRHLYWVCEEGRWPTCEDECPHVAPMMIQGEAAGEYWNALLLSAGSREAALEVLATIRARQVA